MNEKTLYLIKQVQDAGGPLWVGPYPDNDTGEDVVYCQPRRDDVHGAAIATWDWADTAIAIQAIKEHGRIQHQPVVYSVDTKIEADDCGIKTLTMVCTDVYGPQGSLLAVSGYSIADNELDAYLMAWLSRHTESYIEWEDESVELR